MSQYERRLAIVEGTLLAAGVKPAKGKTISEAAVKVLEAVDTIKEELR